VERCFGLKLRLEEVQQLKLEVSFSRTVDEQLTVCPHTYIYELIDLEGQGVDTYVHT
jgi:hypothetical protein